MGMSIVDLSRDAWGSNLEMISLGKSRKKCVVSWILKLYLDFLLEWNFSPQKRQKAVFIFKIVNRPHNIAISFHSIPFRSHIIPRALNVNSYTLFRLRELRTLQHSSNYSRFNLIDYLSLFYTTRNSRSDQKTLKKKLKRENRLKELIEVWFTLLKIERCVLKSSQRKLKIVLNFIIQPNHFSEEQRRDRDGKWEVQQLDGW